VPGPGSVIRSRLLLSQPASELPAKINRPDRRPGDQVSDLWLRHL